jgi:(1->4)-alpha-D-glucan 1-alpha-D-glucosylmutase
MNIPLSTYRLQFNGQFTFRQAKEIIPYLKNLSISHIYASPIFKAAKGSSHGYDIVDPCELNPELGTIQDFKELIDTVKENGLYWLQDIVPNHMAFTAQNEYLMDIFEKGKYSPYYDFFDIDWEHFSEIMRGRVLAPFLGSFYSKILESGEIQLKLDRQGLSVNYYGFSFPLRMDSYTTFLQSAVNNLRSFRFNESTSCNIEKIKTLIEYFKDLKNAGSPGKYEKKVTEAKGRLWETYSSDADVHTIIDLHIQSYNGKKGDPRSFDALDKLLEEQFFRFAFWKVSAEEINYRRFFTVNDLISLRVENKDVFDKVHSLIFRLVKEKTFDGLRVDHIDGLYNPSAYLERLKENCPDIYIIVEKILARGEKMPPWPIHGNTGYDFLNYLNGIFCQQKNGEAFSRIYREFTQQVTPFEDLVAEKKRSIISKHLAGNVDCLAHLLKTITQADRYGRDITIYGIKRALVEILAFFPVYRTYVKPESASQTDLYYLAAAIMKAKEKLPSYQNEINFVARYLLLYPDEAVSEETRAEARKFIMQFQQYTAPVMAKGFEDTILYVYNRLISMNEVGGDPNIFGYSLGEFHNFNQIRVKEGLESFNATSTHDTKRGEDVRARINVLSEIPKEWSKKLSLWSQLNLNKKSLIKNTVAPDANDETFFYQTIIGSLPSAGHDEGYSQRIKEYVIKVVREAKRHTAWVKPDEEYERACLNFIDRILDPSPGNEFLADLLKFQKKITFFGLLNSLSQTLLKITSPGVADHYQGTELWDLNLVDPDNRRQIDFETRKKHLESIKQKEQEPNKLIEELLSNPSDGRIKMFTIYKALHTKKDNPALFRYGDYLPIQIEGAFNSNIIAFARHYEHEWAIIVVPRFLTEVVKEGRWPLEKKTWEDTSFSFNANHTKKWKNVFTDENITPEGRFMIGDVLKEFPVALLVPFKK